MIPTLVCIAMVLMTACGSGGAGDSASTDAANQPTEAASPTDAAIDPADVESVRMGDFVFDPDEVGAIAGEERTLALVNSGDVEHTFTVDDLNVDVEVDDGTEGSVTFTAAEPGTYEIRCRFHKNMSATLLVE